jgi:hypothetical protein
MTTKIFAVMALALLISACEPTSSENSPAPSPTVQPAATPLSSPSAEATPASFKTGDKVKATINGSTVAATIVSLDERAGTAVIKVAGETKERTVTLSEIVKQ